MKPKQVEDFLDDLEQANGLGHDLLIRIRKIVLGLDNRVTEEVKYGGILFSVESPICGLFPYTNHVSLEFGRGAEMADPHNMLEGSGKLRRHIKIAAQPDIFSKNVREYLLLAIEHMKATRAAQRTAKKTRA